jgi:uncharacterized protein YceK
MKHIVLVTVMVAVLTGCGTVRGTAGGFFEGASEDFKSVSTTIKGKK